MAEDNAAVGAAALDSPSPLQCDSHAGAAEPGTPSGTEVAKDSTVVASKVGTADAPDSTTSHASRHSTGGEDELPFTDYYFKSHLKNSRLLTTQNVLDWIDDELVTHVLKDWKENLEGTYVDLALRKKSPKFRWAAIHSAIEKMMVSDTKSRTFAQDHISEEGLEWSPYVTAIVSCCPVLGLQVKRGLDSDQDYHIVNFQYSIAVDLLLTALADLEQDSNGFFQKKLGGAVLATLLPNIPSGGDNGNDDDASPVSTVPPFTRPHRDLNEKKVGPFVQHNHAFEVSMANNNANIRPEPSKGVETTGAEGLSDTATGSSTANFSTVAGLEAQSDDSTTTSSLPFTDAFLKLPFGEEDVPVENIIFWIEDEAVVSILQDWKATHLPDMSSYNQYYMITTRNKPFLARNSSKIAGDIMTYFANPLNERNRKRVGYRWPTHVERLASSLPSLNSESHERTHSEVELERLRVSFLLLLTVLDDLEDNPESYFQEKLGGPVIAEFYATKKPKGRPSRESTGDSDNDHDTPPTSAAPASTNPAHHLNGVTRGPFIEDSEEEDENGTHADTGAAAYATATALSGSAATSAGTEGQSGGSATASPFPFTNDLFTLLTDGGTPPKDVMAWIEDDAVMAVLRDWKATEFPDMTSYCQLKENFNTGNLPLRLQTSERVAEDIFKHLADPKDERAAKNARYHWPTWVQKVANATRPLEDLKDTDDKILNHRMAYLLLLTAFHDLEMNAKGYFQQKLDVPVIAEFRAIRARKSEFRRAPESKFPYGQGRITNVPRNSAGLLVGPDFSSLSYHSPESSSRPLGNTSKEKKGSFDDYDSSFIHSKAGNGSSSHPNTSTVTENAGAKSRLAQSVQTKGDEEPPELANYRIIAQQDEGFNSNFAGLYTSKDSIRQAYADIAQGVGHISDDAFRQQLLLLKGNGATAHSARGQNIEVDSNRDELTTAGIGEASDEVLPTAFLDGDTAESSLFVTNFDSDEENERGGPAIVTATATVAAATETDEQHLQNEDSDADMAPADGLSSVNENGFDDVLNADGGTASDEPLLHGDGDDDGGSPPWEGVPDSDSDSDPVRPHKARRSAALSISSGSRMSDDDIEGSDPHASSDHSFLEDSSMDADDPADESLASPPAQESVPGNSRATSNKKRRRSHRAGSKGQGHVFTKGASGDELSDDGNDGITSMSGDKRVSFSNVIETDDNSDSAVKASETTNDSSLSEEQTGAPPNIASSFASAKHSAKSSFVPKSILKRKSLDNDEALSSSSNAEVADVAATVDEDGVSSFANDENVSDGGVGTSSTESVLSGSANNAAGATPTHAEFDKLKTELASKDLRIQELQGTVEYMQGNLDYANVKIHRQAKMNARNQKRFGRANRIIKSFEEIVDDRDAEAAGFEDWTGFELDDVPLSMRRR